MLLLACGLFLATGSTVTVSTLSPGAKAALSVRMVVSGRCPSKQLVRKQLVAALSDLRPPGSEGSVDVQLVDEGKFYRISMMGLERRFHDPDRQCHNRAEAAALLIGLALAPPALSANSQMETQTGAAEVSPDTPAGPSVPGSSMRALDDSASAAVRVPQAKSSPPLQQAVAPTPSVPTEAKPDPSTAVRVLQAKSSPPLQQAVAPIPSVPTEAKPDPLQGRAWQILLEASVVGSMAPISGDALTGGGDVRISIGTDRFQGVLGGSGLMRTTVAAGQASLLRIPIDVDVRGALRLGRVQLALELGVILGQLEVSSPTFYLGRGWPIDTALRISPAVRIWLGRRIAMSASVPIAVSFATYPLPLASDGLPAATPGLWLGATLGVTGRIF